MSVLDEFPLLMEALLKRHHDEMKQQLLEELGGGQWLDQDSSILGRNKHVKACKRLIRKASPDAHYDASEGRWLMRASAVDAEIVRLNRKLVESGKLPETVPPPAMTPVEPRPLVKTEPPEAEDETGIYDRGVYSAWLERMRGAQ